MKRIGPYILEETLGSGGMGIVYRARHYSSGETVALKTIKTSSEMELNNIRREIRALARIEHPGVVLIVSEGIHNGYPWYAMNFIEGLTLRDFFFPSARSSEGDTALTKSKTSFWQSSTDGEIADESNITDHHPVALER